MATITFTATLADGTTSTRSSGTMPYVAVSVIVNPVTGGQSVYSWHKTYAAAYQAARTGYTAKVAANNGMTAVVLPVVPTSFNGKVTDAWAATATEGWGDVTAEAMAAVINAKTTKGAVVKPVVEDAAKADAKHTTETDAERRARWARNKRASRARRAAAQA